MTTYFLCGACAVLIVVVVELIQLIQSLKRLKTCLAIKEAQMNQLFAELNALENNANTLIAQYEQECA